MKSSAQQLSAEDLRVAGIKSLQNASELVQEAELLFKAGHWSRTVFLCFISGEELGKCFITLSAVMNHMVGRFNEKRYRERFRSHPVKTSSLTLFEELFVSPSNDLPIQPAEIDAATKDTQRLKLSSLYCDYDGTKAYAPSELITKELAFKALRLAKVRVEHFIEHLRPKFDCVLELDPAEIKRWQNEFLSAVAQVSLQNPMT